MFQQVTKVVSYYFKCLISLPYYFFCFKIMLHRCFLVILCCFFGDFCSKIEKNLIIFCNFFSLCINDLRKSYKNNCSKHLTKSVNVVSLQSVKH